MVPAARAVSARRGPPRAESLATGRKKTVFVAVVVAAILAGLLALRFFF
jgi:hypothetical protein